MEDLAVEAENRPVIMLLHGGGLGPWNYRETAAMLQNRFRVVTPVLDGHCGSDRRFVSIEENARALLEFIDKLFGGQVFLIGGLSLGGQILVEMLSQRKDVCKFAVIESALVLPMKGLAALIQPTLSLCYPLIQKRWFARAQFRSLHIKPPLFEEYYRSSAAISKEDMIAFLQANARYNIKNELADCRAKALILVGEKEQRIMKASAQLLGKTIPAASYRLLPGYMHGELSLNHAAEYTEMLLRLAEEDEGFPPGRDKKLAEPKITENNDPPLRQNIR